jgi:hypothetical protein
VSCSKRRSFSIILELHPELRCSESLEVSGSFLRVKTTEYPKGQISVVFGGTVPFVFIAAYFDLHCYSKSSLGIEPT